MKLFTVNSYYLQFLKLFTINNDYLPLTKDIKG